MTEFSTTITDIQLESREGAEVRWRMTLDRTEFRPGDTGVLLATSRTGHKLEIPILGVLAESDGTVWHIVEKPLAAGTDVVGRLNPKGESRAE